MKLSKLLIVIFFVFAVSCTKAQRNRIITGTALPNHSSFSHFLGINAFEWDFSDSEGGVVLEPKLEIMRSFGGFRHYMDWDKLESDKGKYTFNPTRGGGWYYDRIYAKCKEENIEILSDIKDGPGWLMNTYPADQRGYDNAPLPYGLSKSKPSSYELQAKVAFQVAARYGRNKNVDTALLSVNRTQRWNGDPLNEVKVGLGYVRYIECDNERDKTWKGPKAHETAEEYAANMSAFYDGDKGKMGKGVGVKNADPTMKVVMGGLSDPNVDYVIKMIEWCKKNRGYKADGSVDLCFDVINYHLYNNGYDGGKMSVGKAPELCQAADVADKFVAMSKKYANGTEVWITEAGYDLNPASPQRAIAIGSKSALITQADWMLRSALLYARHGLKQAFFYMLDDVDPKSTIQYSSSGFAADNKRRPVADYFYQTKKLIGDFHFAANLDSSPMVDQYDLGQRKMYILFVPNEKGKTAAYDLDLGKAISAKVYTLVPGANEMSMKVMPVKNGKLSLTLTETPIFVEKNK